MASGFKLCARNLTQNRPIFTKTALPAVEL